MTVPDGAGFGAFIAQVKRKTAYADRNTALPYSQGGLQRVIPLMATTGALSDTELASLNEVGIGVWHEVIPADHQTRLLDLGLVYSMLGSLRLTKAGREQITRFP